MLGLLSAAERFDWMRGTPFAAYASWWVRHAMSKAVREATTSVRLPSGTWTSLRRLAKARSANASSSWRTIAERAGVDLEAAENLLPLLGPPLSMDAPVGPGADIPLADVLADRDAEEAIEEVLVAVEAERLLQVADRELTPRERAVLEARYGLGGAEPRTLREVGEQLGVTRSGSPRLKNRRSGSSGPRWVSRQTNRGLETPP